jgi:hypothetical protein
MGNKNGGNIPVLSNDSLHFKLSQIPLFVNCMSPPSTNKTDRHEITGRGTLITPESRLQIKQELYV